jgi:hypothetical protein
MDFELVLADYLNPFGWKMMDIGCALLRFQELQGQEAVEAMKRFILFAKEKNLNTTQIAITIAHDLNGAGTPCFSPRTSGYQNETDRFE